MAKIVILGAGIGGISSAYGLKSVLGKNHHITVIHAVDYFQFVPSNVWAGIGWRNRDEVTIPLKSYLNKYSIDFIPHAATTIDPQSNLITINTGDVIEYDYLVITTGPKLAFHEVPGLGPDTGYTQSICTIDHAEKTWAAYQAFLKAPGPMVIGAISGASCFGPAYEFSFVLNADLRERKLRHKVPMTFITSEPYIGHMGLGGVNDSKALIESEFRKDDIKWITNAKVNKIDQDKIYLTEFDGNGNEIKQHELPFKFSMLLPAFKGVDAVANVNGLCNANGFVLVDEYQRSKKYKNIFAAGVCIAIPPIEQTPVPTGVPKTGYMIETMVTAIVHNIASEIQGKAPSTQASWGSICLADMGNTGIAFVAIPELPPRNINWAKKGKWVHLAKIAFEKYYLYKVKHGLSEPVYEKYILEMLGIKRLE